MVNEEGQSATLVIDALRRATASQHSALEALLQLETSLDLQRYVTVLRGFEVFLREWEPHIRSTLSAALVPRFDQHRRLHLVRRDLVALNAAPASDDSFGISRRLELPDVPAALGSWYVLAGSALGGQVIARHVLPSLGITAEAGGGYFYGWGQDTGRRWREFLLLLEQTVPAASCDSAAQAAQTTFDLLIDVFQQVLHEPATA